MADKTGGPAFPHPPVLAETGADSYWSQHPQPGMTLRDYFAAKADVSAYMPIHTFEGANGRKPTVNELAAYIADIRYTEADTMIARRGDA